MRPLRLAPMLVRNRLLKRPRVLEFRVTAKVNLHRTFDQRPVRLAAVFVCYRLQKTVIFIEFLIVDRFEKRRYLCAIGCKTVIYNLHRNFNRRPLRIYHANKPLNAMRPLRLAPVLVRNRLENSYLHRFVFIKDCFE